MAGSRTSLALAVALLVAAGTLVGVTSAGADVGRDRAVRSNHSAGSGALVAGAAAAERTRARWTVERRAFERAFERAPTASAKAAVVAATLNESTDRLDALRERAADLGEEPGGRHAAREARIGAGADGIRRLAVAMEDAAATLPRAALRRRGASVAEIRELRDAAARLAERHGADEFDAALFRDVARLVDGYNARASAAGDPLGGQLRGERVDLYVGAGDDAIASFRVDGRNRITELRAGGRGDATLRVRADRATVERLADADDVAVALRRAVADDEVEIVGVGPVNRLKWAGIDLLADLLGAL